MFSKQENRRSSGNVNNKHQNHPVSLSLRIVKTGKGNSLEKKFIYSVGIYPTLPPYSVHNISST